MFPVLYDEERILPAIRQAGRQPDRQTYSYQAIADEETGKVSTC